MSAIPEAAQYKVVAESVINLLIGDFLKPSMGVTYMEEGHMVSDQYAGFSTKQVVMVVPTIFAGGLGAAMAIPAFQKVRTTSQEKAVTNNLRQIASAADQYFLENGVTEVSIDKLVGEGGYIRVLKPVAGESYEGMIIQQGEDISVVLENGSVISMPF
jgi:type IV pilus assembly protein PilA